jgi:hypothetical protein
LLCFFNTKEATALRAVSVEFRDTTATFPFFDEKTHIPGKYIRRWHSCFPNARAARFCDTVIPAVDFKRLRDLEKLDFCFGSRFSMAAFLVTDFHRLKILKLCYKELECEDLELMSGFQCPQLTNLNLFACEGLTSFFACVKIPQLKILSLLGNNADVYTELMNFEGLYFRNLTNLTFDGGFTHFTSGQFPNLTDLNVHCSGLTSLNGLEHPLLTNLFLGDFKGISLEGLRCPRLTKLIMSNFDLPSLESLECPGLMKLILYGCEGLTKLDITPFPLLTDLNIIKCCSCLAESNLQASQLTSFSLYCCENLTSLEGLKFPGLTKLDLGGCGNLTNLDISQFPLLTKLILEGCSGLTKASMAALQRDQLTIRNS